MITVAPAKVSAPTRRRFDVFEYHAMGRACILPEDASVELLDGDVIQMPRVSNWHAGNVTRLTSEFLIPLQDQVIVSVRNPVRLDHYNEVQPDVKLLKHRDDFYIRKTPAPDDVLLLIEVSDNTLAYDRGVKLSAYARAGIREAWIVSRPDRRFEIYSEPEGDKFSNVRHIGPGGTIAPRAFPDVVLEVGKVVGE